MLIEWKDSYRTGIDEVDFEHRELIDLVNALHAQLTADGGALSATAFFGDLEVAIAAHFALEERLMREGGYSALREHKADHERLLDQLRTIADDWERDGTPGRADALGPVLDTWFSRHFRTHDARLHTELGPHPPG
jgi:hemerythrin